MDLWEILSLIIGLTGILLGTAFYSKFQSAIKLLKELGDLLKKTGDVFEKSAEALKDRKITKAESVLLVKAWQDACIEFTEVYLALVELLPASAIKFLFRR